MHADAAAGRLGSMDWPQLALLPRINVHTAAMGTAACMPNIAVLSSVDRARSGQSSIRKHYLRPRRSTTKTNAAQTVRNH